MNNNLMNDYRTLLKRSLPYLIILLTGFLIGLAFYYVLPHGFTQSALNGSLIILSGLILAVLLIAVLLPFLYRTFHLDEFPPSRMYEVCENTLKVLLLRREDVERTTFYNVEEEIPKLTKLFLSGIITFLALGALLIIMGSAIAVGALLSSYMQIHRLDEQQNLFLTQNESLQKQQEALDQQNQWLQQQITLMNTQNQTLQKQSDFITRTTEHDVHREIYSHIRTLLEHPNEPAYLETARTALSSIGIEAATPCVSLSVSKATDSVRLLALEILSDFTIRYGTDTIWNIQNQFGPVEFAPGADLQNARLSQLSLVKAELSNTNLNNAQFNGAIMNSARLVRAQMNHAEFNSADLQNADLSNAQLAGAQMSGANLRLVNLTSSNLQNAILRNANLKNAALTYASLNGVDASAAVLDNAALIQAQLQRAVFDQADLHLANLQSANVSGAYFSRSNLQSALFYVQSWLEIASISKANINNIKAEAGFREWALERGAVDAENFQEWHTSLSPSLIESATD
ncbi:MAG: pentapeptide repeat-containing protein [bacterium]